MELSRRKLMIVAAAASVVVVKPAFSADPASVHVRKDPSCGCCGDWITVMREAGFTVTAQDMPNAQLNGFKAAQGITPALASCHTAEVGGYVIEGHVPPADVRRLLETRPDAIGLSVPGMPYGSPGMGPESEREAYQVVLVMKDGQHKVFADYAAAD